MRLQEMDPIAETAVIHTLQLLERICARDERVENVTDGAG